MTTAQISLTLALAVFAGFVRGVTGFGGGMVLTAPLSLIVGPREGIVTALLLEAFAVLPMMPAALRRVSVRTILPICAAAAVCVPVGSFYLATVDGAVVRRTIGAVVLAFALLLLSGYRYKGVQRTGTSIALGATAGVLVGAVGVGGPPIIAYLLAGPDPAAVTRANITTILVGISVFALIAGWGTGLLRETSPMLALWLTLPFAFGNWAGTRLYFTFNEQQFRRVALALISIIALWALIA